MIFLENEAKTNLESIQSGIRNYSVITDQLADSLHDLTLVSARQSKDLADKVNKAENLVRQASIELATIEEELNSNSI